MTYTQTTRDMLDGRATRRNMTNGKPYRTKSQKAQARSNAVLCNDGVYRSDAPVSYHRATEVR